MAIPEGRNDSQGWRWVGDVSRLSRGGAFSTVNKIGLYHLADAPSAAYRRANDPSAITRYQMSLISLHPQPMVGLDIRVSFNKHPALISGLHLLTAFIDA